ncbi:MAG: M23 family metallopeptidase, partial [bacterium]
LNSNTVIQGEPVLLSINNATVAEIKKIYFKDKSLWFYNYKNKPTAIIGTDFYEKPGDYAIKIILENGQEINRTLKVTARQKMIEPLSVPAKLGGNSASNQTKVVSTLSQENIVLSSIKDERKKFWTQDFIWPLTNNIITDPYGYIRQTGAYNITHKGFDLSAKENTKVLSVNSGVVKLVKKFTVYGWTVVIDHGFGVDSIYMHLNKPLVKQGELVNIGQNIALSGATGYAEFAHLHFSLRISGVSVDPKKFLNLFE